jgi:putative chitobiose transport system permease protein
MKLSPKRLSVLMAWLKSLLVYAVLIAIALIMLLPLLWLTSTALKSPTENIFQFPPQFLPAQPTLQNFVTVWNSQPFGQYFINSLLVSVLTVVLNLIFCSLAAYPLARLNFVGKDWIFAGVISTIMIPFQIVMIPLYILTGRYFSGDRLSLRYFPVAPSLHDSPQRP